MKAFIVPLLLIFTVISCGSPKGEESLTSKIISNEKKIEYILSPEFDIDLGLNEEGKALLFRFYQKRGFKALWIDNNSLSEKGEILQHYLKNPILFGLSKKRLGNINWSDEYALENEIIITYLLARFYPDLKYGVIDSTRTQLKPIQFASIDMLDTLFDFKSDQKEIAQKIIAWGPSDSTYQKLAFGLFDYAASRNLRAKKVVMPSQKEDSTQSFIIARQILIEKQYLSEEDSLGQTLVALKKFQADSGNKNDGIIGQSTIDALTETDLQKCQRAALAMEKWRWKNTFPTRFIWVNIPEYTLRFYDNDTLRSENKVIVGRYKNQTPEFSSKLHAIVVYPFWNVPYSITSKEMLPDAKRNANYFERNHLKIFKKGEEIDPKSVNWSKIKDETFPYKVRQEPGSHNSLGILKLEFSNNYSVYIHDTPNKNLFNTIQRSYSHGCVRCQNVVDLAKTILIADENKHVPDSLDTLLFRETNYTISLKKRIPIYLDYITVVPKFPNQLLFLKDVYLKDEKYLSILFSRNFMV
jgi:murein L,D-transpeptidase YcbB/YkuD